MKYKDLELIEKLRGKVDYERERLGNIGEFDERTYSFCVSYEEFKALFAFLDEIEFDIKIRPK